VRHQEALDLGDLDVGVLGTSDGGSGYPPGRPLEPGGQVGRLPAERTIAVHGPGRAPPRERAARAGYVFFNWDRTHTLQAWLVIAAILASLSYQALMRRRLLTQDEDR